MPDIDVSIETIFANQSANGDSWVGALATFRATTAEDNKPIEMQEIWVFRISEDKIAERWYVYDQSVPPQLINLASNAAKCLKYQLFA